MLGIWKVRLPSGSLEIECVASSQLDSYGLHLLHTRNYSKVYLQSKCQVPGQARPTKPKSIVPISKTKICPTSNSNKNKCIIIALYQQAKQPQPGASLSYELALSLHQAVLFCTLQVVRYSRGLFREELLRVAASDSICLAMKRLALSSCSANLERPSADVAIAFSKRLRQDSE